MKNPIDESLTTPVEQGSTLHPGYIFMIYLGLMIALPAFMVGAEISNTFGAVRGISASFFGGLVLALVASASAYIGTKSRLSTYVLIVAAFGTRGAMLINGIMAFSILCAFGIIATMFSQALLSSPLEWVKSISSGSAMAMGCALAIATTLAGVTGLKILSAISTPLKVILILWYFDISIRSDMGAVLAFVPDVETPLGTGISMVAGALILGAISMPDICRFARTPIQAVLIAASTFGICLPLILTLCGLPSLVTHERDAIAVMVALGLGLPALFMVLLTAWAINTLNLYSATLVIATFRPRQPRWHLVLAGGAVGTVLGLSGLDKVLMEYFFWLGLLISPVGGIYILNYILNLKAAAPSTDQKWRAGALVCWAAGAMSAAALFKLNIGVTGVPTLDAMLIASAGYMGARLLGRRPPTNVNSCAS